jgi:DNA replication protein DnaC
MTPISIKKAIEEARSKRVESQLNLNLKRTFIAMSAEEFYELMKIKCERIFMERSEPKKFVFDSNNSSVVEKLYLYGTGDQLFQGSIHKGIHLWGDFGTGKTSILQAFSEIISETTSKIVETILAKEFGHKLLNRGINYYSKKPLFIDDLGRETLEIKDFGNVTRPVVDLYYMRKETGAWTLQTCQHPITFKGKEQSDDPLIARYGKFTMDRMRAAFNEIELKGTSRRS